MSSELQIVEQSIDELSARRGVRAVASEKRDRSEKISALLAKMAAFVRKFNETIGVLNELRKEIGLSEIEYNPDAKFFFVKKTLSALLVNVFSCRYRDERNALVLLVSDVLKEWVRDLETMLSLVNITSTATIDFIRGEKHLKQHLIDQTAAQSSEIESKDETIRKQNEKIQNLKEIVDNLLSLKSAINNVPNMFMATSNEIDETDTDEKF